MLTIALLGKKLSPRAAGTIGTLAIALAFVFAVLTLIKLQALPHDARVETTALWDLVNVDGVKVQLGLYVDPLSTFMILVVTGVSTLIHLYSAGYMQTDAGYVRYFSYLNFFVFSMLLLVLAGNMVLLIIGWAFVGAASYMLVSYWYRRDTATAAGIKAFVINVVGDIGLVLGTLFLFKTMGVLDYGQLFSGAHTAFEKDAPELVIAMLLILVGAFAKSAQIPFQTWLPDAMEGPTPVSSLIHAATMVTAGVYLIGRLHVLFEWAPTAAAVGAIVGALTLLIAGSIGLVMTDLKRVIAYSTMSQIGYMIMGVSAAAYVGGFFHMMTHAFFKALLFMAAGSVISAMGGNQSLNNMSGFRKALPFTFGCFLAGGFALSAFPLFSGFFSKDTLLFEVGARGGWYWGLYVAGYIGAAFTVFYTWRMIYRAFWGEPCKEAQVVIETGHAYHPAEHTNPHTGDEDDPSTQEVEDSEVGFPGKEHKYAETTWQMRYAMIPLAILAVIAGVIQLPFGVTNVLSSFLEPTFANTIVDYEPDNSGLEAFGLALSSVIAIVSLACAYWIWVRKPGTSAAIQARLPWLHKLFINKWYFDQFYSIFVVRPVVWIGQWAQDSFERVVINGALIGGTSGLVKAGSAAVRALQTGLIRAYAALVIGGLSVVLLYFLVRGL
ncbi:MAG: NADH-quinone oxidoreductase subunit L [Solirubrobacteraceae bacterium]|nr:NADH-quinone oxidoreductase subunit L [Solirubrobacteraceae bacterium]